MLSPTITVLAGLAILSLIWLVYPFLIYPLLLRIFADRFHKQLANTWLRSEGDPRPSSIAVLFCAYNEASVLEGKLTNLLQCVEKSPVPVNIRVYLDGCTDQSAYIANHFAPTVEVYSSPLRAGKSTGMKLLAENSKEDVLIFTDANVLFAPDLFVATVELFASDPSLGCIAGSTVFTNHASSTNSQVESGYWRLEETIKHLESRTGSCLCGTGAIFAIRRELFVAPPADIIDDFHTTLNILLQRRRVVQSERLLVYERAATSSKDEWMRKVRITCRAFNCFRYLRSKLKALPIPLRFIFFSHKWIRWFSAIPFTIVFASTVALIFAISRATGIAVLILVAVAFSLGLYGIRPFSSIIAVTRALYATFWGIIRSLHGDRFATWNPVKSTRDK